MSISPPEPQKAPKIKATSWVLRCFRHTQAVADGIGREWITRNLVETKNLLVSPTCGASFMQQLLDECRRIDGYPSEAANDQEAADVHEKVLDPGWIPASPAPETYKKQAREMAAATKEKFEKGEATWDDYYALRKWILPLYPEKELFRQTMALREDYKSSASKGQWDAYQIVEGKPLDIDTDRPTILSHALFLQEEMAKLETYRPHQELKRNYITYDLFASLVATVALELVVSLLICKWVGYSESVHCPFICLVMILGALGASVSYQRRIQESFDSDGSILNTTRYVGSGVGVKLTPMQGSVFAMVLLFLVYSGLATTVTDAILPKVSTPPTSETIASTPLTPVPRSSSPAGNVPETGAPNHNPATLGSAAAPPLAAATTPGEHPKGDEAKKQPSNDERGPRFQLFVIGPIDVVQFAKLLVFAFLAGFAERLVPDTLDRLTLKSAKEKS